MTNREIKLEIIEALFQRGVYTRRVKDDQFVTRCPYCGDSDNPNTGHFYIKINPDDNYNIVYNCFKCPENGILTKEVLTMLGIHDVNLNAGVTQLSKSSDKFDSKYIYDESKEPSFDFVCPDIQKGWKTEYIKQRLGYSFTANDFRTMRVITSLDDFYKENHLKNFTCSKYVAQKIEAQYVGFLSSKKSHILFRDVTGKEKKYTWLKYPITEDSRRTRVIYSLKKDVDPLSTEKIFVNLAEGVFDTISIAYNLGYIYKNSLNITVLGNYYLAMIKNLINIGLIGSNVIINIFSDNDREFNDKNVEKTTLEFYRRTLKRYSLLFGGVYVYYNKIYKDCGVSKESIQLVRYNL